MLETIPEVFFEAVKKYPDKAALLYKKEGVYTAITYKELSEKVEIFSGWFSDFGISKGDRIAILSENRPEWVISDLSIMVAGAVVVPLHTTLNDKAVCDILKHSEAGIVIVSTSGLLNRFLLNSETFEKIKKVICLETLTAEQKDILKNKAVSWGEIFSKNINCKFEKTFLNPEDCCSVIYTSGTTGEPKGVMLTHRNFLSNVEAVNKVIPVKESDIFLSFLPLSHVLERMAGYYMPICFGATIAYAESAKHLPADLKEARPTIMISVPRIFEKFHDAIWDKVNSSGKLQRIIFKWALRQKKNTLRYKIADSAVFKKIRRQMGGRLRLTISGGASLDESIGKFFSKIGITILEGYGLTETSPVISANQESDFKFGTVGKIIPGTIVKIAENKEILVKGPGVFKGYFKREPVGCFDKDGWFCTGDLGFIDKKGFLTVIGRSKEMIVTSGGKNVWPEPIESLLNNDRFISQSIIIGNNRKFISALIVPDWQEIEIYFKQNNLFLQGHDKLINSQSVLEIIQKRIDEKINSGLNDFEKIKKFRLLSQEFSQEQGELTATLKLRRHVIETRNDKIIESIYS